MNRGCSSTPCLINGVHIHDPSQLTIDDQLYYLIPPKKHDWNTLGYTTYSTNHTHQLIMDASPGDQPTWMILALGRWGFIWMNLLSTVTGSLGTTHKMEVPARVWVSQLRSRCLRNSANFWGVYQSITYEFICKDASCFNYELSVDDLWDLKSLKLDFGMMYSP